MVMELNGQHDGRDLKIAIVAARFNESITRKLLVGAIEGLRSCNVEEDNITVYWVPGTLELGIIAKIVAESGTYSSMVCLGAVIRGETGHYDVVSMGGTSAIMRASLDTETPIAMGVLTTDNLDQAMDRSGGAMGNKGYDAALVAVEMANLIKAIKEL